MALDRLGMMRAAAPLFVTRVDTLVRCVPPRAALADAAYRTEVGGGRAIEELRTYLLRADGPAEARN